MKKGNKRRKQTPAQELASHLLALDARISGLETLLGELQLDVVRRSQTVMAGLFQLQAGFDVRVSPTSAYSGTVAQEAAKKAKEQGR